MKIFLLDLWHDLRAKRLWPVAAVLGLALVAVPVVLSKPSETPAPAPPTARKAPGPQGPQGAGEREARADRRAWLLARHVRPERPVPPAEEGHEALQAGRGRGLERRGRDAQLRRRRHRLDRRHGSTGGGTTGGGETPSTGGGDAPTTTVQYRYVVDLTFTANGRKRHIKGMERLDMLPSQDSPLLLFLGVSANAGNAVFLVDSTLEAAGEGKCKPRASDCAFLYIGAGSEHEFTNEEGDSYTLRIDEIRKVKVDGSRRRQPQQERPRGDRFAGSAPPLRFTAARGRRERVQRQRRQIQPTIRTVDRGKDMRRLLTISLLALAAALVAVPTALAASGPEPSITRVTPMRVSVGNLLTIRGTHFKARRLRNTVIFRGPDGRTAFAKPRRATTTKLVVRVPAAVSRLLRVSGSRQRPTRLKLRVLSARKFSKFTSRRLSPVVTGVGDGDGGGAGGGGGTLVVCNSSPDHDGDLLANSLELAIGTDPCLADTDNDQMSDGWEYWAAKDLNVKAVPYPGKKPFPNALDPSDGGAALEPRSATSTSTATASRRSRSTAPGATPAARSTPRRPAASTSSRRSATATARSSAARARRRGVPGVAERLVRAAGAAAQARSRRPTTSGRPPVARRRARRGRRRPLELARVRPRTGQAELLAGLLEGRGAPIEPWKKTAYCGPGGAAPGRLRPSGRSRTSTWPTRTSTATRCSTARTTRTTTTSPTSPSCTRSSTTWTATARAGLGVNPAWCGKPEGRGAIPTIDRRRH